MLGVYARSVVIRVGGTTIATAPLKPDSIKGPLRLCGYRSDLLRSDFTFGQNQTVPLVGFAQPLADSRSACVAVVSSTAGPRLAVETCRTLGAPLVFVCFQNTLQWWKQGATSPEYRESIQANEVEQFFQRHQDEFSPERVYRAKTWGRFDTAYQLSFVDLGLLPIVEEEVGTALGRLIEHTLSDLKKKLGWIEVTSAQGHWLFQTVFWLVSGKILHDKQVESFENLDLNDAEEIFKRVGKHYGAKPLEVGSQKKLEALNAAARSISQFSSLVLTTTEALAYVYENTLITKKTRSDLGTHSTPSFLVDYIVGNLADWVKEIPTNERSVYEPACGHAAFMVSAMRLLTELLPDEKKIPSKRGPYLRSRLHGTDIDSFALELARLSLTLTDIPNPDGWDLTAEDMFLGNRLAEQAKRNTILLANPPFDNFSLNEQQRYSKKGHGVRFFNKSAEMLWQTLPHLPEGGVFGLVLPQNFLHSDNAREMREFITHNCELREVCLFPDKVFSFSDAESAVIVGRRKKVMGSNHVRYRRVRERELQSFRSNYTAATRSVLQSRFLQDKSSSLRLPDLEDVWRACANNPRLSDVATIGQGLIYHGKHLPFGSKTFSKQQFSESHRGFVLFNVGLQLHQLPAHHWMNLDPSVIRRPMSGTALRIPQVLLNYAPASRGPWRLKALIDEQGHPVTSRFIAVRPTLSSHSLETLWALLNSPVANAYAFSHLGKRDNLVGDIRNIPIPKVSSFENVQTATTEYFAAAAAHADSTILQKLLMRVDCEVLKLYSLPLEVEQSVLALFTGWERVGVPFRQTQYLPKELLGLVRFADFLRFEEDWSVVNRERGKLIDKNVAGTLTAEERSQLQAMQTYADYHIEKVSPRPSWVLDELEDHLFSRTSMKGQDV